ncbi:hypothetical protein K2173_024207 [Erythroxylum novogranatense]|uniref:Uncharacterized protein n=1 Tax=Erythroxylum novogranatense TaxID=1862640 RepID=A0AAV8UF12_9ROSI|nr:hypothetical protein K2173_024207 [Erythroxylum novogranatense]
MARQGGGVQLWKLQDTNRRRDLTVTSHRCRCNGHLYGLRGNVRIRVEIIQETPQLGGSRFSLLSDPDIFGAVHMDGNTITDNREDSGFGQHLNLNDVVGKRKQTLHGTKSTSVGAERHQLTNGVAQPRVDYRGLLEVEALSPIEPLDM